MATITLQDILEQNISACENPSNRTITECEFYAPDETHLQVWIRSNYGGWAENVKVLTTLGVASIGVLTNFCSNDFIGLTEFEADTMLEEETLNYLLGCTCIVDEF